MLAEPATADPNDVRRLFGLKLDTGEGGLLDSFIAFDGDGGDVESAASAIVRLLDIRSRAIAIAAFKALPSAGNRAR